MAAPRAALNPTTNSVGFTAKLVTVRSVSADGSTAVVVDRQNTQTSVTMLVQRGKGPLPAPGETWLISQDLGMWTFAAFSASSQFQFSEFGLVIPTFPLTAADPAQFALGNLVAETWHDVPAAAGFTVDTVQRYRLMPDNTVHIQFSLASVNAADTYTLFTLPKGYIPSAQFDSGGVGIVNTDDSYATALLNTRFRVTTAGAVQLVTIPGTAVNNYSGYFTVPLG